MKMSLIDDRRRGCLYGLAIGDALGAAVEFKPKGSFPPVRGYRDGGPHNLNAGEWTDDTSTALALADSIAMMGWDLYNQMERYCAWYQEGEYSVNGKCFDIGNQTRRALIAFLQGRKIQPSESGDGNGSIMRLAPVPITYYNLYSEDAKPLNELLLFASESSIVTHPSDVCMMSCRTLAVLLSAMIKGVDRFEIMAKFGFMSEVVPEMTQVYRNYRSGNVKGTGYVLDSLASALWAFAGALSFEDAVLRAVNLGEDADTTGAVTGQLAGAYWGYSNIPKYLIDGLAKKEMIDTALKGLGVQW